MGKKRNDRLTVGVVFIAVGCALIVTVSVLGGALMAIAGALMLAQAYFGGARTSR